MFLGENRLKNRIIKRLDLVRQNQKTKTKIKHWLWFVLLWCLGFLGTLTLVYGTKSLFWIGKMLVS